MEKIEEAAIKSGVAGDWQTAIKLNREIVDRHKHNLDALNRLCFAYIQNGNKTLARRILKQVLTLDKFNIIGLKNQNLINSFSKKMKKNSVVSTNINFIEEPGITKIIYLIDCCPKSILLKIRPGTKLEFRLRRRKLCVNLNGQYLGKLPDDLNKKLLIAMNKKHKNYDIFFKSYDINKPSVLLREIAGKNHKTETVTL